MRKINQITGTIWLVLGATLAALGLRGTVTEFWAGLGSTLLIVGALKLLRYHRCQKNPAVREKMEIAETDERLRYIRSKAWSWAGYFFIIIAGLGTVAFKMADQDLLSKASSWAVCLMLALYWLSWLVLRKKY